MQAETLTVIQTQAPRPAYASPAESGELGSALQVVALFCKKLSNDADHPEIWAEWGTFLKAFPELPTAISRCLAHPGQAHMPALRIAQALCMAQGGNAQQALAELEPFSVHHSQSPLVQGAIFFLRGMLAPEDPRYKLQGKICPTPFQQMDVLDGSSHLCCASWLKVSAGNLFLDEWQNVWNSAKAQEIRASIHDGSYRYCNKMACPIIQSDELTPAGRLAGESAEWKEIVETKQTRINTGPREVNLAYDRTCNLRCPSCRSEAYSADTPMRGRFEQLQEKSILPLLREAKSVFVTGSGDPFASRNFRQLLTQLGAENYPELRFILMTNGMLLTPSEWAKFPSLHGRVKKLKISIDAARQETHERLRLGSRWKTMLVNMAFAGELRRANLVHDYELVFTVQQDNYKEMGEAVDLANHVGADTVYFARITNWGTFTPSEYAHKAVFLTSHPEHAEFLEAMRDPRLRLQSVNLGDLTPFVEQAPSGSFIVAGL